MKDVNVRERSSMLTPPPDRPQLSGARILRMGIAALRHHLVASILQICTIAATGAFLTFVLGEIASMRVARELAIPVNLPEGAMARLVWILVIALLVCTISNVTSMLLSVTKRFREIGTMKCLGAFDRTILVMFLCEAVILGGVGALAGAVSGGLVSFVVSLARYGTPILTPVFALNLGAAVGITFLVVLFLGLVGAAYPAWQASRMMPVQAMRSV